MRLLIGLAIFVFTITACKKPRRERNKLPEKRILWADSLVELYVTHKQKDFVKRTGRDTLVTNWEMYDVLRTDTAAYYEYVLYHSFGERSETEEKVCVDSASRRFYQYDEEEDRLIKWP